MVDHDDSHLYKSLGCAAQNIVHACPACEFACTLVTYDEVADRIKTNVKRDKTKKPTDLSDAIIHRL